MLNSKKPKTYSIKVSESIIVKDKNDTYKRWFNGVKHFFTVKIDRLGMSHAKTQRKDETPSYH